MKNLRRFDITPRTAEETKETETCDGMRKRIFRYAYEDALTRAVMDIARFNGMSGDDTMVLLAYQALVSREKLMDECYEAALFAMPKPIIVERAEVDGSQLGLNPSKE